ncbi:MAG: InlB B-repeat-containing protein, partial [Christensenellales bacterium]
MKKHIALKLFIAVLAIAVFACALTACEKNKGGYFTVSFTGEGVDIQSQTVAAGGKAVQPKSPEREGYEFVGWTLAGESFSFDTPINSDIVLTAAWRQVVAPQPSDKGDGSKENPYILSSPNDLIEFSERVNTPDEEGNENYYKSYFRLGSDIDMSGYDYTPAGQVFITSDDETINGFMGSFDGAGHKISNLKIVKSLQRKKSYYVGFFGVTERADIRNVTFENIEYDVISGADVEEIEVYYGGVVGEASLTNFSDVTVTGVLDTHLFESNPAYIGGIAGSWHVDGGGTAYIAYMENCYSAVETKIGRDDEGQLCALDSAVNGGLVGYLYTYGCAASIVNSVSDGKVYGGKYLGGLIAYISGNYVSVVNCANYSSVIATATEVSYTGGIIGYTYGDNAIMDSYSTGRVKGERATSSYNSYAGNLVGYAVDDDYEKYYSAGIAIINSYYVRNLSASGVMVIDRGTEKDASELTAEWVKTNLRWSDSDMSFEGNKARPATKSINDADFVLDIDGEKYDRKAIGGSYALIGALDAAENKEGEVFFDYMFEGGIRYRFYLPVVKDVYLYAHYQDVSGIVGVYTGTGTLHETRDAGIMVLNDDGTLQWINSTSVGGVYTFDGTHIIINVYNGIGEVSGTIDRTGKISFVADAGITGDVSYEFDKSDLKIFGEYFSDNGDVVTFSGETGISFHTVGINNNDTISGTYSLSEDGNTVTVTGGRLKNFYESMTFTVNADLSLTAEIVAKDGVANDFAGVTFNKILNRDYTGRPFVGTYKMPYPNNSSDFGVYQEMYTWEFKADGNVDYTNAFSSKIGSYYVFGEGTVVKVFLEGYIASFVYDSEKNIFYGDLNRGSYAHVYTVITSQSEGSPKALVIDRESGNIVYATDRNAYYMKNKQFSPSSVITCENNFADNDRVVVDGTPYRLIYTRQREGYALVEIGEEEGTYIYNGEAFFIDGIGNVTGSISGTYNVYDDNLIVILTEDRDDNSAMELVA